MFSYPFLFYVILRGIFFLHFSRFQLGLYATLLFYSFDSSIFLIDVLLYTA